ncbi:MAG: hypothetical protein NVS3B26_16470 [Mycobacteriales bacterium]
MTQPTFGPNQNPGRNFDNLTDQSGTLTPTMRVNAGGAAYGQTLKSYTGSTSVATGATITLETVTTGKTFFITDIYVGSNTATVFSVTINSGATAIYNGYCKGDTGPVVLMGIETQPSAASGSVVQLVLGTAATTTSAWMICGYEQ